MLSTVGHEGLCCVVAILARVSRHCTTVRMLPQLFPSTCMAATSLGERGASGRLLGGGST